MPITCYECDRVVMLPRDHADDCDVPERIEQRHRDYLDDLPDELKDAWGIDDRGDE